MKRPYFEISHEEAADLFDAVLDVLNNVDDCVEHTSGTLTLTLFTDLYEKMINVVTDIMRENRAKRRA